MKSRKQYIGQLIASFKTEMLPAISSEDPKVMECMLKAHIEDANNGKLPIEFQIGFLFDAVWIWCREAGIELPGDSDYKKDFEEFCNQLMEPWPIDSFMCAGLKITHIHKSNMKIRHRYKISHVS
jgi:hypothetical protein